MGRRTHECQRGLEVSEATHGHLSPIDCTCRWRQRPKWPLLARSGHSDATSLRFRTSASWTTWPRSSPLMHPGVWSCSHRAWVPRPDFRASVQLSVFQSVT